MSEEIICLSSSDDEDTCIQNSTTVRTKFNNVTQKRRLSESFDDKTEVKKPKISNGVINIDEDDEDSEPKSDLNSNIKNKKSVKFESNITKSGNKSTRKRSPSPIAGTSRYFDLIENQSPKKSAYDKKEEKLPSVHPQNSKTSKKVPSESEEEHSTPFSEKSVKRIKPQLIVKEVVPIPDPSEDIFEKILKTCREKKECDDIEIALQKIKKYYDELAPIDKESEEFRLFLNSCLNKILNSNQFFKHLVDIKMEMIRRIKKKKTKADNEHTNETDQDKVVSESEEIELTEDEARKVRKLEKVIKKCKATIEKLENQEVDFDEEDNSAYIKVDRYKKKLVELCSELSRIANDRMLKKQIQKRLLKRKDIPDEMTGIIYVDDAIIRFINSSIKQANELKHIKNPNAVAAYLFMPDYVDILQCIKQCNEERNLELKNRKMEKLAEKAFKAVGNYLKNQRLQETKDYLSSFVENSEGDPAKSNKDLSKKLKNNKEVGIKKLEGIFAKYVAKQEGLSSEGSASENEENDSFEDESNDEDNTTNKNEDILSSPNKNSAPSRGNSVDKSKKSISRKRIIPTISSDDEEDVKNKEICKGSSETDPNEVIKENLDNVKSSKLEATSSTEKLTNSSDTAINITCDNQVKEKNLPSEKINEAVTILSEICEVSNNLTNDENKLCTEADVDEIEILSDNSDTNKENNEVLEKESSQDIVLEIEDEDPLSITEDNAGEGSKDNYSSTSAVKTAEEKKGKIEQEKVSDEIQNKRVSTSKNSNERSTTERDLKDNNDNDSSKIDNENTNKVVGKVYPLQARDNHEDSKKEETPISSNKKASSADVIIDVTKESSFLKVRSFAKPPESWKDMSPEKSPKNPKLSIQQPIKQVLQQMSKPECVDLTNENEIRSSSSTRFINPLALKKRRVPVNKLVVVKNVTNNFNFSLPADGVRDRNRTVPLSKVQVVTPQVNKSILVSKAPCVQVNQVPPNNHNQRSNEISTSIVKTPFVTLTSTKKKNDNSNSPSTVK